MVQSVKDVAWLEWFRLRLPHIVPVSFALVDGLILLHAASIDLMTIQGPGKNLFPFQESSSPRHTAYTLTS